MSNEQKQKLKDYRNEYYKNIFFWAYNFIINKITRSLIMTK